MSNIKSQKGATLIGVLIGITVLSVALAAQLRLLSVTIRREAQLRNSIIATNLAREGVEIGVLWRNTNYWNDLIGVSKCPDIINPVADCGSDLTLEFSSTNFFLYNEPSSIESQKFNRIVEIHDCDILPNSECLEISSTVGWEGGEDVTLTKKIFNWYNPNE